MTKFPQTHAVRLTVVRVRWWLCGLRGHDWDTDTYRDEGAPMSVCRRCGIA